MTKAPLAGAADGAPRPLADTVLDTLPIAALPCRMPTANLMLCPDWHGDLAVVVPLQRAKGGDR